MMYDWMAPAMYGPFHWLVFAAVVAVIVYPIGRILRRLGFSPLWAVLVSDGEPAWPLDSRFVRLAKQLDTE